MLDRSALDSNLPDNSSYEIVPSNIRDVVDAAVLMSDTNTTDYAEFSMHTPYGLSLESMGFDLSQQSPADDATGYTWYLGQDPLDWTPGYWLIWDDSFTYGARGPIQPASIFDNNPGSPVGHYGWDASLGTLFGWSDTAIEFDVVDSGNGVFTVTAYNAGGSGLANPVSFTFNAKYWCLEDNNFSGTVGNASFASTADYAGKSNICNFLVDNIYSPAHYLNFSGGTLGNSTWTISGAGAFSGSCAGSSGSTTNATNASHLLSGSYDCHWFSIGGYTVLGDGVWGIYKNGGEITSNGYFNGTSQGIQGETGCYLWIDSVAQTLYFGTSYKGTPQWSITNGNFTGACAQVYGTGYGYGNLFCNVSNGTANLLGVFNAGGGASGVSMLLADQSNASFIEVQNSTTGAANYIYPDHLLLNATAGLPSSPVVGMIAIDSTTSPKHLKFYNGTSWITMA